MHKIAAEWVQDHLSELPLDVRDKFKHLETPGPAVDIYTAWEMYKYYCHWSAIPVTEAIRIGIKSGIFTKGFEVDIEVCIKEMLEAASALIREHDKQVPNRVVISDLSETLAERTISMDEWLRRGGPKPVRWNHDRVHC